MKLLRWLFLIFPLTFFSCSTKDYYSIPLYSEDHVMQAVVEIPAGSSQIIDYCNETHRFNLVDSQGESTDLFLALPFNFGFIPSTRIKTSLSEAEEPLDVCILCGSLNTGNVLEILPLGLVTIKSRHDIESRIIAIPFDESERTIDADNYDDLIENYPGVVHVIEEWMVHSVPFSDTGSVSWQDEVLASKLIESLAMNK